MSKKNVPKIYKDLYIEKIQGFRVFYTPHGKPSIILLNPEAFFVFNLIDGKKNLDSVFKEIQKKDKQAVFSDVMRIVSSLERAGIIYFEGKKREVVFSSTRKLSIWFHITNQCNLRCKYCFVDKRDSAMSFDKGKMAIMKIIESALENHFQKIEVKFTGGEPLLEFQKILKLIDFARKQIQDKKIKIKTRFAIISNGILVTKDVARVLKRKNIYIGVSLDGTEKYHNIQRVFPDGKGSFKAVERGVNNLLREEVSFNIIMTITSRNVENIPVFIRYLFRKNIPFILNFFQENPCAEKSLKAETEKLIYYLRKGYGIISHNSFKKKVVGINNILNRALFTCPHVYGCGAGRNYFTIRPDGRIAVCPMMIENTVGSVEKGDLGRLIKEENPLFEKISVERKKSCKDCRFKYICAGGCPYLILSQKQDINSPSPYCEVYKTLVPEILRMEAKRLLSNHLKSCVAQ